MEDDKRSVTSSRSAPPVPLQTYIWEDIRRQKIRGLYPWTHLYKGPFTGSLDIELESLQHYMDDIWTSSHQFKYHTLARSTSFNFEDRTKGMFTLLDG
ncbi:hypothetical protein WDU94_001131 [Cyamophila willieti]